MADGDKPQIADMASTEKDKSDEVKKSIHTELGGGDTSGNAINGAVEAGPSSKPDAVEDPAKEPLSICLYCGKKDRSVEFIIPDHYCSQSCADKHGSSDYGDTVKFGKPKYGSKGVNSSSHNAPGKRKKKRASYLSAYEEDFRMDAIDDRKPSKPMKARTFTWRKFIADEKLTAAPNEVFIKEPPAEYVNTFTVGMKMEGIDPLHPSIYCVLSIVETKGLRLRLRFDGYAECHDFWTYANSDEIFPVGWCTEMGKELQTPKGIAKEAFNWEKYLLLSKSAAAPHSLFTVCSKEFLAKKPAFQIGDKLEAVDVKNKNTYICVATVADTYGDKILVHFDGWEDNYDYWCYYNSAHIHHVGWCQESLKTLSAPNEYEDPSHFTWESYLEETNSRAAPLDAFEPVVPHGFNAKMALEVVDKRNPCLVRVAEILVVNETLLCIHFCGWDNKYDYWEEADSPDLHPVGWCQRTGHSLQPPLTPLDIVNYSGPCPTLGCYGYGHVKGAKFSGHHSICGCPYSDVNLNRDNIIVDRLGFRRAEVFDRNSPSVSPPAPNMGQCSTPGCDGSGHVTGKFPSHFTISGCPLAEVNQNKVMKNLSIDTSQMSVPRRRRRGSSLRGGRGKRARRGTMDRGFSMNGEIKLEVIDYMGEDHSLTDIKPSPPCTIMPPPPARQSPQTILQNEVHNSVFLPAIPAQRPKPLPPCWDRNIKLLPGISSVPFSKVPAWTSKQVADFLTVVAPGITDPQRRHFIDEKIDGTAFLLLNQSDITSILKLKLGPAIKIYNSVLVIKKALGQM